MRPPEDNARELLEAAFERLNARDIERFLELVHPDAKFVPLLAGVETGEYHGRDGVRRWLTSVFDAWPSLQVRLKALHPVTEWIIVLEFVLLLRGRASDVELETQGFGVLERDRSLAKITAWRFFETLEAARGAASASAALAERPDRRS